MPMVYRYKLSSNLNTDGDMQIRNIKELILPDNFARNVRKLVKRICKLI